MTGLQSRKSKKEKAERNLKHTPLAKLEQKKSCA
jgi:hypothetical protein